MHLLKHRSMRFYLGFFLVLALTIGGSAIAAFADTPVSTPVSVPVSVGTDTGVGQATVVPASTVVLNGTDQTATYTMGIPVVDDSGSGNGWNVSIDSTQFDTAGATCQTTTGYHTLSTGASTVYGVASANNVPVVNGTPAPATYATPTNSVSYTSLTVPAVVCSTNVDPGAVELFNAANNSGMGHFLLTATINIFIPANTYVGTYQSTITLGFASGPT
jgi:hypothetical protein